MKALPTRQHMMLTKMVDPSGMFDESDRSRMVMSVVISMVNRGWARTDVHEALTNGQHELSQWALRKRRSDKSRSSADAQRRINTTYDNAVAWVKERPALVESMETFVELARIADAIDEAPWPGQTGGSDYVAMAALVQLAYKVRSVVIGCSTRQLSELSGLSVPTAGKALGRLVDAGWLRVAEPSDGKRSTRYALRVVDSFYTVRSEGSGVTRTGKNLSRCRAVDFGHDAFAWLGLGRSASRVLGELIASEQYLELGEIAQALGVHKKTVERAVKRLEAALLVDVQGNSVGLLDGVLDNLADALGWVAVELGTNGKRERKIADHQAERQYHLARKVGAMMKRYVSAEHITVDPITFDVWLGDELLCNAMS